MKQTAPHFLQRGRQKRMGRRNFCCCCLAGVKSPQLYHFTGGWFTSMPLTNKTVVWLFLCILSIAFCVLLHLHQGWTTCSPPGNFGLQLLSVTTSEANGKGRCCTATSGGPHVLHNWPMDWIPMWLPSPSPVPFADIILVAHWMT